jgi:hypothetical protein
MVDRAGIDEKQVSRVYGKQVNEAAERRLSLLIPARTSRQTLYTFSRVA